MTNLYYLSSFDTGRILRQVFLLVSAGVVTILCHAEGLFPTVNVYGDGNGSGSIARHDLIGGVKNDATTGILAVDANATPEKGQPKAENDYASTNEETPVTVNVLANDQSAQAEDKDDDDEDEYRINPATVDLDPDGDGRQSSLTTSSGTYSVDDAGNVTFTPVMNFFGSAAIQYIVQSHGGDASNKATIGIEVKNVNDAPVISGTRQADLQAQAGQPFTIRMEHFIISDPDSQSESDFSLSVLSGANYTVSGTTITPLPEFSGSLPVSVQVSDGMAFSEPVTLTLSVAKVNAAPVITGQHPISIAENTSVTIALSHLIISDPDSDPSTFSISVGAGENYTVSGQTITPATNFSGTLSASVTVSDGESNSAPYSLQITVNAVNERPVITGQTTLTTEEDKPLTITLSNIFVSDADNPYPSGFTFRLLAGSGYTIDGPVIIPAPDFAGTLAVPVIVNDGTDDSEAFTLQVTVQGVNDAPVITGQVPLSTPENQTISLSLAHLFVSDPDNEYPGTFTLSVLTGDNYSASGNQITPAPGFNGVLTVQVFVNDGSIGSNIFPLQISVTPINDPPVITGQTAVTVVEGTAFTLALADLTVTDNDNTYPDGFTLIVQAGANYTVAGTTVTPSADFTGTLHVGVVVNDGASNSQPFSFAVTVTPQNDPPQITGPSTLTTSEDVPLTIALTDLQVTDPDNPYPSGFSLLLFPGAHYTESGNTIIPEPDYSGPLAVQVQVSDGSLTSNIFTINVNVSPVNDPPVITGQVPLSTNEDTPVTLQLSHLSVLDVDNTYPTGFSLLIAPGTNYTVAGSVITPAMDFNGTLNVSVQVSDGSASSAPFNFQIQVGNSNDAPLITGQAALSTPEETPITLALSHMVVVDPDNAYPTGFSLLVSPGVNYSVSGQTITPSLDFAGVLSIPVRVNDGINNSPTFDFKLQVNQVNDPPVFAAIPNQRITENATAGSITITGISKGPMEQDQQLTFVATSGNTSVIKDPVIQYGGGSTATLSYSLVPNTSGVVTITIVAIDNGSNVAPNQNSYSSSFQIEVLEINSAPTLNVINNITVMEDAEQQNVALSGITAGPGETQSLSVTVTSSRPDFFDLLEIVYTSPESSGLLRFKTRPDMFGTVQLSVTVTDNGPGTTPHVNRITRSFSVVVQPVNDPPVFTSVPLALAVINEAYEYRVQVTDPDGQRVTISAPVKPSWATLSAGGTNEAILKGKPPADALGNTEVKLTAQDVSSTVEQSFTVYVNVRPVITTVSITAEEDTPVAFSSAFFNSGYTDANDNALSAIFITALPSYGELLLSDLSVKVGDTIQASALPKLIYSPDENYFGMDFFGWKASDGYHASLGQARVDVTIIPINDPPKIAFQNDTLHYEVNGESAFLAPLLNIIDPDDDTLTHASVSFSSQNYRPEMDLLQFQATAGIDGVFDFASGVLRLSGRAPISAYMTVLRSIQYLHQNTVDPLLEPKNVSFTLNDGETEGAPQNKVIMLQYTFIEFEIPSGFTPNGDEANDTWIIDRPGGGLEEMVNAVISVYNKQGVLVYRRKGFDAPWDGTTNGQLLPADTYFYIIDLGLRNKKTYKGIVTILR